ncbi:MAG: multicopper oxidase type 2 [Acidobacteria bacterium]|nr:multicopper oxidase type 2 [Acidobacteriota bacterium]
MIRPGSRGFALIAATLTCAACGSGAAPLPDPPVVRSRDGLAEMTLTATRATDGRHAFAFDGQDVAPTIRIAPGDTLRIHYVNALPPAAPRAILAAPMNMSNLHFHGLSVSPDRPADDVLEMMAMPGEALDYRVAIPRHHLPGLHWYHTHPHGESHQQVLDGMSAALIVEGIEAYAPQVRGLRERVLVIRASDIEHDPHAAAARARVEVDRASCGESHDPVERVFTINGVLRPEIAMAPGERQFWRIVNAAADRYVDIAIPDQRFEVVAYDGQPIADHDPAHPTRLVDHVLVPPAGRVEAIVTAPARGGRSVFRTRCVDTGPDGDPNPAMVLADIATAKGAATPATSATVVSRPAPPSRLIDAQPLEREPPAFTLVFSEDRRGFYINGLKFTADAAPMVRAKVGTYQHWLVVNDSRELHPMHIHQVHFLAFRENGQAIADPRWLDTVNVSAGGSVDVLMDFTDPVIRGMSVFHCHLLNHEDKGMMAKILFE